MAAATHVRLFKSLLPITRDIIYFNRYFRDMDEDEESHESVVESRQDDRNEDRDIVEEPELLLRAEAKVSGRSLRQWRRLLRLHSDKDARWIGIALLIAVVAIWIWITYNR